MGLYVPQVLTEFVRPALNAMEPRIRRTDAAEELLMMVAAHESGGFRYVAQTPGPARGLWQMEPGTFEWLLEDIAPTVPGSNGFSCGQPTFNQLTWNMRFAAAYARLRFWAVDAPLPDFHDTWNQARYAKKFYNSIKGKATVEDYVRGYETFVKPHRLWG